MLLLLLFATKPWNPERRGLVVLLEMGSHHFRAPCRHRANKVSQSVGTSQRGAKRPEKRVPIIENAFLLVNYCGLPGSNEPRAAIVCVKVLTQPRL